jgi:anti-sigma factor RsiW
MTDYLEGTLSAADRARFEDHIAGCDGCRTYLEQLRTSLRITGRLAAVAVPQALRKELLRAFRDWKSS